MTGASRYISDALIEKRLAATHKGVACEAYFHTHPDGATFSPPDIANVATSGIVSFMANAAGEVWVAVPTGATEDVKFTSAPKFAFWAHEIKNQRCVYNAPAGMEFIHANRPPFTPLDDDLDYQQYRDVVGTIALGLHVAVYK